MGGRTRSGEDTEGHPAFGELGPGTHTVDGEAGLVEDGGELGLVPHKIGLAVLAGVKEGGHEGEAGQGEARHQAPPQAGQHWGRRLEKPFMY